MRNMSAKDLAFERERTRLLSQIAALRNTVSEQRAEILELQTALDSSLTKMAKLQQEIQYIGQALKEDDLQLLLEKERRHREALETLNSMRSLMQIL